MDEIGREIRRLREEKGWTQAKLAVDAGIGVSAVSLIETGKRNPSATTLAKIAQALGVGVADLFPLGQAPLPLEGEEVKRQPTSPAGWQSLAEVRSELLEEAAKLWDTQLERGQYDWQTLKAMESVGFRLALNHTLEARAMKQWLTAEQLAQLEYAEKRYGAHARKIVGLLRRVSEEEKKKLSEREVVHMERYISQREAALEELNLTA